MTNDLRAGNYYRWVIENDSDEERRKHHVTLAIKRCKMLKPYRKLGYDLDDATKLTQYTI